MLPSRSRTFNRKATKPTLIQALVAIVIVGVIVLFIWAFTSGGYDSSPYCDGPNKVYPGYDQSRPPTVVPNDPTCM